MSRYPLDEPEAPRRNSPDSTEHGRRRARSSGDSWRTERLSARPEASEADSQRDYRRDQQNRHHSAPSKSWISLKPPRDIALSIAGGGVAGIVLRFILSQFSDSTVWALIVDIVGCVGIGILMTYVNEMWSERRLVRPFVSVGVLGGFTIASTYAVDVMRLIAEGHTVKAIGYVIGTVILLLGSTCAGIAGTQRYLRSRSQPRTPPRSAPPSQEEPPRGGVYGRRSTTR